MSNESEGKVSEREHPTIIVSELQPEASVQIEPGLLREMEEQKRVDAEKRRDAANAKQTRQRRVDADRARDVVSSIDISFDLQDVAKKRKSAYSAWKDVSSAIGSLSEQSRDAIFPSDAETHKILLPVPENAKKWFEGWKYRDPGFFRKIFGESAKVAVVRNALEAFIGSDTFQDWEKARKKVNGKK